GAAAGECASAVAVGTIEQFALGALKWLLTLEEGPNETAVLGEVKGALRGADAGGCEEAARHPELQGKGTTVTRACSGWPRLFSADVGDSRAYLMHAGRLARLTQDHTLVQQMVAQGILTPEGAAQHDLRHVITNVVGGTKPGVQTEVHKLDIVPGDTL